MPIHDWKRAPAGLFHDFHQTWSIQIKVALNNGVLPNGFFALVEQKALGKEPDVLTLTAKQSPHRFDPFEGGIAVAESPPKTRHVSEVTDKQSYAVRANRISVRTAIGELVAVIEIVSPGNKDRNHSIRAFAEKTWDFLSKGVHVLVLDLFPPTSRDPKGIHRVIWDEIRKDVYSPPKKKPLTLASYVGDPIYTAYVEAAGIGDVVPSMPIFLDRYQYVNVPLEETYMQTWRNCPREMREMVEKPKT